MFCRWRNLEIDKLRIHNILKATTLALGVTLSPTLFAAS